MDTIRLEEIELFLTGGFNGATTLRSWIPAGFVLVTEEVVAFQWGHNLAVMDTHIGASFRTYSCCKLRIS